MFYIYELGSKQRSTIAQTITQDFMPNFDAYTWWSDEPYRIPPLAFTVDREKVLLDCYRWPGGIELCSEKLIAIYKQFQVHMDISPVSIYYSDNHEEIFGKYQAFRPLNFLDGLDSEKTEYARYRSPVRTPDFTKPRKLVMSKAILSDPPALFRLKEHRSLIIVHTLLKEAIDKNGITGINFIPLEEFILELSGFEVIRDS
ncbi:MAG: DUF1629 domain-containing protein [Chloroflexota bacterium]